MNYDQTLAKFFDSPKKRLIATISVVAITVLLVTTTWFLIICKEERKNLEGEVKSLKVSLAEKPQALPAVPVCSITSEEVKTAVAEVCGPKAEIKPKPAQPKQKTALKPLPRKDITPSKKVEEVVVSEALPPGCRYTSDGKMVLKNGRNIPKGVEVARIFNTELVKEYPTAMENKKEHKKACGLWREYTANKIQAAGAYVNNDAHMVQE